MSELDIVAQEHGIDVAAPDALIRALDVIRRQDEIIVEGASRPVIVEGAPERSVFLNNWIRRRRAKGWEGIGYLVENGFDVENDDGATIEAWGERAKAPLRGRRRDWTCPCDWGNVDAVLHRILDDLPRPAHRQEDT